MGITYCEKWHRAYGEPIGALDEAAALALNRDGKPYVVVIEDAAKPTCFIEVNREFYGVSFLDEKKREFLLYDFALLDEQTLFLQEAIHREYEADSRRVASATAYRFWTDGRVAVERLTNSGSVESLETSADVSRNFEKRPQFGEYEALTRRERA